MKYARWIILAGMAAFVAVTMLALSACQTAETHITGYKGKMPIGSVKTVSFLYGTFNYSNTLFGIIQTGELNIGFAKLADMFTTMVGAIEVGNVAVQQEITKQLASAGATKVQISQFKYAAQQAAATGKTTTDITKIGADAGAFQTGGTVFKQP